MNLFNNPYFFNTCNHDDIMSLHIKNIMKWKTKKKLLQLLKKHFQKV